MLNCSPLRSGTVDSMLSKNGHTVPSVGPESGTDPSPVRRPPGLESGTRILRHTPGGWHGCPATLAGPGLPPGSSPYCCLFSQPAAPAFLCDLQLSHFIFPTYRFSFMRARVHFLKFEIQNLSHLLMIPFLELTLKEVPLFQLTCQPHRQRGPGPSLLCR